MTDSVGHQAMARRYWEYYDRATSSRREDQVEADAMFDAYMAVEDLMDDPSADRVGLLRVLAETARDAAALSYFAAGPLEDLYQEAGSMERAALDAAARSSAPLADALAEVEAWFAGLPPALRREARKSRGRGRGGRSDGRRP